MRIPTLRNIALTAPYMHDGSMATLDDVFAHYEQAGMASDRDPALGRFTLTLLKRKQLRAFLASLTDIDFIRNQRVAMDLSVSHGRATE